MVELMVVIFIIGILAAIAAPNLGQMVRVQRIKTSAFDVLASLTFARGEAIKRNVAVTVAPTVAGDWSKGWRVTDVNNNVLKEQGALSSVTVAGPANVAFAGSGRLSSAPTQFDISTPYVNANSLRCVRIDGSGRPSSKEGAC